MTHNNDDPARDDELTLKSWKLAYSHKARESSGLKTEIKQVRKKLTAAHAEIKRLQDGAAASRTIIEAMLSGHTAEIEAKDATIAQLTAALGDTIDNGLIHWEPQTQRGRVEKSKMISRGLEALAAVRDAKGAV